MSAAYTFTVSGVEIKATMVRRTIPAETISGSDEEDEGGEIDREKLDRVQKALNAFKESGEADRPFSVKVEVVREEGQAEPAKMPRKLLF